MEKSKDNCDFELKSFVDLIYGESFGDLKKGGWRRFEVQRLK
jgi:hypothetical protein